MGIVKDLTVGQTLKVYEDGTAVEFIVAQHDYEKDLNGKGKTMLMRTGLLADTVRWGSSSSTGQSYANSSEPRSWLTNTYAKRLSQDVLDVIKPVTIRYKAGDSNGYSSLADQRFFIPMVDDFGGNSDVCKFLTEHKVDYADSRATQNVDASNSDNEGGYYYALRSNVYYGTYSYVETQFQMPTSGNILV